MKKYSKKTIIREDLKNKSGECPIVIRYIYDRKTLIIAVGLTIRPEGWDENEGCPIPSKTPNFKLVYKQITSKEDDVDSKINQFLNEFGQYPTTKELKMILSNNLHVKLKVSGKHSVSNLFNEFIELSKSEKKPSANTIKVFKSCYLHFMKFERTTNSSISVEDINKDLMIQFQSHLWRLNLQHSSINKYLKYFKSFVNKHLIDRRNYDINPSFMTLKSSSEDRKEKFDVLSNKEVEQLKHLVYLGEDSNEIKEGGEEIILSEREKLIGRMFLFQCYTGLSFSDLLQISFFNIHFPQLENIKKIQEIYNNLESQSHEERKNLKEGCIIAFERQKTKVPCLIPLFGTTIELIALQYFKLFNTNLDSWEVIRIMENEHDRITYLKQILNQFKRTYDKNKKQSIEIFPKVSNQNYNREIKVLFKKINLNNTQKIKLDNINENIVVKSKWEMITSHTARRTYITLNINKGLGIDTIMRTTGHKNFETLRIYIKQSQQSVYEEFSRVVQN
jgi:site-specific recombinase XerD